MHVSQVFMAHTYLELQQNEQAVRIYDGLSQAGLAESTYIMAQVGHVMPLYSHSAVECHVSYSHGVQRCT